MTASGLSACTLVPVPHQVGFFVTGKAGIDAGYAFHHFARPLAPTPVPGGFPFFAQWIALGSGQTWPGGLSEAIRVQVQ